MSHPYPGQGYPGHQQPSYSTGAAPSGPTPKKRGGSIAMIIIGAVLLVASPILGAISVAIGGLSGIDDTVDSGEVFSSQIIIDTTAAEEWTLYTTSAATQSPSECQAISYEGETLTVSGPSVDTSFKPASGPKYQAFAVFDVPANTQVQITCPAEGNDYLVIPSTKVEEFLGGLLGGVALGFIVGGVLFIAGVVLLIVGIVKLVKANKYNRGLMFNQQAAPGGYGHYPQPGYQQPGQQSHQQHQNPPYPDQR